MVGRSYVTFVSRCRWWRQPPPDLASLGAAEKKKEPPRRRYPTTQVLAAAADEVSAAILIVRYARPKFQARSSAQASCFMTGSLRALSAWRLSLSTPGRQRAALVDTAATGASGWGQVGARR